MLIRLPIRALLTLACLETIETLKGYIMSRSKKVPDFDFIKAEAQATEEAINNLYLTMEAFRANSTGSEVSPTDLRELQTSLLIASRDLLDSACKLGTSILQAENAAIIAKLKGDVAKVPFPRD